MITIQDISRDWAGVILSKRYSNTRRMNECNNYLTREFDVKYNGCIIHVRLYNFAKSGLTIGARATAARRDTTNYVVEIDMQFDDVLLELIAHEACHVAHWMARGREETICDHTGELTLRIYNALIKGSR